MARLSPNAPCPCGSGHKYKKCCAPYHKGARPKDARTLMRSRYSAYAAGESGYIIRTTHPQNPDYRTDRTAWKREIDAYLKEERFEKLEILSFSEAGEEAFVTFVATLGSGEMREKSRFRRVDGVWLYLDGSFF